MARSLQIQLLLVLIAACLTGCAAAPSASPSVASPSTPRPVLPDTPVPSPTLAEAAHGVISIEAANQYFNPAAVTAKVGTTIVWKDVQDTHNIVADDGSFSSDVLFEGGSFSHTFATPGHYHYICTLHVGAGMWADIDID